jgi:hypothetical protein
LGQRGDQTAGPGFRIVGMAAEYHNPEFLDCMASLWGGGTRQRGETQRERGREDPDWQGQLTFILDGEILDPLIHHPLSLRSLRRAIKSSFFPGFVTADWVAPSLN